MRPPVFVAGFQGGQFPAVTGDDWCGGFRQDAAIARADSLRNAKQHNGSMIYTGGESRFVAGKMLTAEELAEFSAEADGIMAKRMAR